MRHPNADMIIAKANDMSLVLLSKAANCWLATYNKLMPVGDEQYYLCRPQHKEACLAWLNWENVQVKSLSGDRFIDIPYTGEPIWSLSSVFLDESRDIRIKPKKEKRWIAVAKNGGVTLHYPSKELVEKVLEHHSLSDSYQIIEIEVEV